MRKILVLIVTLSVLVMVAGCGGEEALNGVVELDTSIEEREGSIGKSDKDFLELKTTKPSEVRGDNTGDWRKITISESVDIEEYILSYNSLYMEEDQVHAIVNFNYKTTTMLNDFGNTVSVRIHEYVDKEEHDASKLGSGMLLKEYEVYKDNGDIIEIK